VLSLKRSGSSKTDDNGGLWTDWVFNGTSTQKGQFVPAVHINSSSRTFQTTETKNKKKNI